MEQRSSLETHRASFKGPSGAEKAVEIKRRDDKEIVNFFERHQAALSERKRFDDQIARYDFRDFQAILNPESVKNQEFEKILQAWLLRVNEQTDYLKPLASLGIRIFADDLECQGAFPNHTISFTSKRIELRNLLEASHIAGLAHVLAPVIEIKAPKPDVRQQLFYLLSQGHVGEVSETLIHELIHRYHLRERPDIHGILTEAQAYLSGIYGRDKNLSIQKIAETLTRVPDGKQAALYQFDTEETVGALEDITTLYATGSSYADVARILIDSDLDPATKKFEPLTSVAREARKRGGLETSDHAAIEEAYRVHAYNESAKARLALFSVIQEHIPFEKLRELRLADLRTRILHPTLFADGKPVLSGEHLGRRVICPINETYPYEPNGKRTGIVFGFFATDQQADHVFKIGRWEAGQTNAETLFPADLDGDETANYLKDLRVQADQIKFEDKKDLALLYARQPFRQESLARAALRALVKPEDWKQIIAETLPDFKEKASVLKKGVEQALKGDRRAWDAETVRRLKSYQEAGATMQAVFDFSGLKPENIDQEFASDLREVEFSLRYTFGQH